MPNPFAHIELTTADLKAAQKFYSKVFGWKLKDVPGMNYTMIDVGGGTGGGMQLKPMPEAPTGWMPYVQVDDVKASVAKATKAGAMPLLPYQDIGDMGAIGVFSDPTGAVIGVNAAFWAGHPLQPAQGIGFAIPINIAKSLLPRLKDKGDAPRSYLGVDAQPLDSALTVALKLESTRGALIASVAKKSPAEAGGLEPGDVVVSWNGTPVATSEDLKIDAQLTLPGTRVKVGLYREGRPIEREVTTRAVETRVQTSPHPSSCSRKRDVIGGSAEDLQVADVPSTQAASLPGGRGVSISQMSDHGAAAQAGLKVGDILLRVGKNGIRSPADLTAALRAFKGGAAIPILVRRGGFDFWTAFTSR